MADTDLVGRKFAIVVLESMPPNYIEALIQSKAPEWKARHLLPAQHKIIFKKKEQFTVSLQRRSGLAIHYSVPHKTTQTLES
ncbi:hypothetical protein SLE2022_150390 [Rubroshorea leprosula]